MLPFYIQNVGDENAKFIINGHYRYTGEPAYIFALYSSINNDEFEPLSHHYAGDHIMFNDTMQLYETFGTTISILPGQRIYLKIASARVFSNTWYYSTFKRCSFIMSGKVTLGGNVMSLANSEYLTDNESPNYCLKRIFNSREMYNGGFYSDGFSDVPCLSIVKAPEFPNIKLSTGCYQEMFYDCANLEGSISLNATELATDCYTDMFHGCQKVSELHFPKSFANGGNEIFKNMPGSPNFGAVNAKVMFDL